MRYVSGLIAAGLIGFILGGALAQTQLAGIEGRYQTCLQMLNGVHYVPPMPNMWPPRKPNDPGSV